MAAFLGFCGTRYTPLTCTISTQKLSLPPNKDGLAAWFIRYSDTITNHMTPANSAPTGGSAYFPPPPLATSDGSGNTGGDLQYNGNFPELNAYLLDQAQVWL